MVSKLMTASAFRVTALWVLALFLAISFQQNPLGFANKHSFSAFGKGSEALVLGAILAEKYNLPMQGAHLGYVFQDEKNRHRDGNINHSGRRIYEFFETDLSESKLEFTPYKSQFGGQGLFFSKLQSLFGIEKLTTLQLISSITFAAVIVSIFSMYQRLLDNLFAMVFVIVMASSPWILSFGRNLYWMPALWFLPTLLSLHLYVAKSSVSRALLLGGIAAAICVKSLCGYEYLAPITLLACSIFIIGPMFGDDRRPRLYSFLLVFAACVVGFILALLIHAPSRGDTLISGLLNILEQDVKRRTYGDPSIFPQIYRASLESGLIEVINNYITNWRTPVFFWLPGSLFPLLLGIATIITFFQLFRRTERRIQYLILLTYFFAVGVSWHVLAKAHSFLHPHMNYVLWYFGFVQSAVYIIIRSIFDLSSVRWIAGDTPGDGGDVQAPGAPAAPHPGRQLA